MPHLLILEPDAVLAASLSSYLANANFSVAVHSDPQAAVISMDKKLPDAIVCELQLAGRSGVEFLYELRSYPEWQGIPVIVYTNLELRQAQEYQEVLDELGVAACLRKADTGSADLLAYVMQVAAPVHEKV